MPHSYYLSGAVDESERKQALKTSGSGWVVYRIDRDGSALFLGIFPTPDKANEEASALGQTHAGEWLVTELPLLDWEGGKPVSPHEHPRPNFIM